jgi:hypothetical protein
VGVRSLPCVALTLGCLLAAATTGWAARALPAAHALPARALPAAQPLPARALPAGHALPPAHVLPAAAAAARVPVWGVTVDSISQAGRVVSSLAGLPDRPTARVYFDVRRPARYYAQAVRRIHRVSAVMGELLDSSDEKAISVTRFRARVKSYLHVLGRQVDIWEIGNEVNGNWTGPYPVVTAKLTRAYDAVHAAGAATALTLYANNFGPGHCGDGAAELTPVQFSRRYVPARVAGGLSYVLLSYYPSQCGGREPSSAALAATLRQLHGIYPRAALGFGEVGMPSPVSGARLHQARQVMRWAYSLSPRLPYYVGGYFWWYAAEDALHPGALLRTDLRAAFRAESAALGAGA